MNTNSENDVQGKTPRVNITIGLVLIVIGIYLIFAEYININLPIWGTGTALQVVGLAGIAAYFITRPQLRILSLSCVLFSFGLFITLRHIAWRWNWYAGWSGWEGWVLALGFGLILAFILSKGKTKHLHFGIISVAIASTLIVLDSSYSVYFHQTPRWQVILSIVIIASGLSYLIKAIVPNNRQTDE